MHCFDGYLDFFGSCKDSGAQSYGPTFFKRPECLVRQWSAMQACSTLNLKRLIQNHCNLTTILIPDIERHDPHILALNWR